MIKKFGILGAWCIECYLGAHLLQAGFEVVFVGRERLRREILEYGFTISVFTGRQFFIPVKKISYETTAQISNEN